MKPKKTKVHVVIFLLSLFISCSQQPEYKDIVYLTNIITEEMSIVDLFEDFEYISLETSEESIFGRIKKLIIYEDRYYILDPMTKKIFVFQQDGAFIRTVGNLGKGPGEYSHLEDFVIDEVNGKIIILGFPSIIYIYDLDGVFLKQIRLSIPPVWSMCSYGENFAFSNNHQCLNESLIYIFDKEFNLIEKIGKVLDGGSVLPPFISHPFLKDGKNIAYFDNFRSTLHYIMNHDREIINFKLKKPVPFEIFSRDALLFFERQHEYSFFSSVFMADNILWSSFIDQGKMYMFVKDMENKKQVAARYNDWYPDIMSYMDGYLYAPMDISWTLDENPVLESAKTLTKYPIDDNSNAVILRFKPRKQVFD